MNVFDYYIFRVYDFFKKRNDGFLRTHVVMFLVFLEMTSFTLINLIIETFFNFKLVKVYLNNNTEYKYLIICVIASIMCVLNYIYLIRKEKEGYFLKIEVKYKRNKYWIPNWIILSVPIIILIIAVAIPGVVNGTGHSPFLEQLLK